MEQISGVLRKIEGGYSHWCPACREMHAIAVEQPQANGARWLYDGYAEKPTFHPSINISATDHEENPPQLLMRCHYFIVSGKIIFCADCTHAMKDQTVDLPALPQGYQD